MTTWSAPPPSWKSSKSALELRRCGYGSAGEGWLRNLYSCTEDQVGAVRRSVLQWRVHRLGGRTHRREGAARGAVEQGRRSGLRTRLRRRSVPRAEQDEVARGPAYGAGGRRTCLAGLEVGTTSSRVWPLMPQVVCSRLRPRLLDPLAHAAAWAGPSRILRTGGRATETGARRAARGARSHWTASACQVRCTALSRSSDQERALRYRPSSGTTSGPAVECAEIEERDRSRAPDRFHRQPRAAGSSAP